MKKIASIIIAMLLCCSAAFAVPAYRGFVKYTQPDGSVVFIQKHGDEFFHWATNVSGQAVEQDKDGFWRPVSADRLNARRNAAMARRNARRPMYKSGEHVAIGPKHFLVILVEFSDVYFKSATANADFHNQLNQNGYSVNGGTGSAKDYYFDNSHGVFEPIFDVYGPIRLNGAMADYGANDSEGNDMAPHLAVAEGCEALDDQIDFSQYDLDGDGAVDLVFMYYAGYGEADGGSEDTIWPHQWDLSDAEVSLTLDGKKVSKYACSNELDGYGANSGKMTGIGTVCHEFGHAMGLPDFYDTDYDYYNGEAGGTYDYDVMCGGPYNNNGCTPPYVNMIERIMLGWLDYDAIAEFPKSGTYTLTGINNNVAYMTPTDKDGEFFLYECRSKEGWDAYIPEAGLIVYHVDQSDRQVKIFNAMTGSNISVTAKSLWDQWEMFNCINENGSHPCFYIVPAGAQTNLYYTGSQFAFPGKANKTSYVAKSWNGVNSAITFSGISYAGNQVSCYVTVPSEELDYSVIANPGNGVYAAGSSFELSLVESESRPVASVEWYFDDEPVAATSVVLRAGAHTVEAVLTLTSGETETLTLELTAE